MVEKEGRKKRSRIKWRVISYLQGGKYSHIFDGVFFPLLGFMQEFYSPH